MWVANKGQLDMGSVTGGWVASSCLVYHEYIISYHIIYIYR